MSLQFITDSNGETTGVFIPINEWNKLKDKYKDIDQEKINIPQWQKDLVLKRIKESDKNPERLLNWDDVKNDFKVD